MRRRIAAAWGSLQRASRRSVRAVLMVDAPMVGAPTAPALPRAPADRVGAMVDGLIVPIVARCA